MKKYALFGLAAFVLAWVATVGANVFAESVNSGPGSISAGKNASPMIVNIGPSGNVLLRGIVVGTPAEGSIKVKSWGGSWTVNITSATKLMSIKQVIADFEDGDFVGVMGTISSDGSPTIDANIVREWRGKLEVRDADKDGIPNDQDVDDDNDGIPDVSDSKPFDGNNDGISDDSDNDDDDDGVDDSRDRRNHDYDNDGIKDFRDKDDDNDGILDINDTKPHDSDNDGKNNREDSDDDNDGKDDSVDDDDDNDGHDDDDEEDEEDDDNSGSN
jgi:hypothetical protein